MAGRAERAIDADAAVVIRRNSRARRMSLRVSHVDGRAVLTAPSWVPDRQIARFLEEHRDWIAAARHQARGRDVAPGAMLPVEGAPHEIRHLGGRRGAARIGAGRIEVPGDAQDLGRRVAAALKLRARDRILPLAETHAAAIGRRFGKVTLRDTRSRWGSCSARGDLMFSWRLIMAPPEVLDYVVAHEVAHLAEMNHSDRFWRQVARIDPDFRDHRDWLRRHGTELHAWCFGD